MPDNVQRFLADGGSDYGLSLKVFWGSVVEAFRNRVMLFPFNGMYADNVGPQFIAHKALSGTNSTQFLMWSDMPAAEEHTPGDELNGQQFEVEDGTISIDGFLTAHVEVPEDQLLASHFDVLQQAGSKLGYQLADKYDRRLFVLGCNAARTAAVTKNGRTIHNGGNLVQGTNATVAGAYPVSSAGAIAYRNSAEELAQAMDEDDVPETGRYLFITPYIRRVLNQDTSIFDVRYSQNSNDNNFNNRLIGKLAGFDILVANNKLPRTNITLATEPTYSKYRGDFTVGATTGTPVGLALCGAQDGMAAIGSVSLQGIVPEMEKDIKRSVYFMKAQILMGADVMHPWCAGSIEVQSA